RPPPVAPRFPCTTLFRSPVAAGRFGCALVRAGLRCRRSLGRLGTRGLGLDHPGKEVVAGARLVCRGWSGLCGGGTECGEEFEMRSEEHTSELQSRESSYA